MIRLVALALYCAVAVALVIHLARRAKPAAPAVGPEPTIWLTREEFRLVKEGAHTIRGGLWRGEDGPVKFGITWAELKELSRAGVPEEDLPVAVSVDDPEWTRSHPVVNEVYGQTLHNHTGPRLDEFVNERVHIETKETVE